jgi:hypothetical protein
LLETLKEKCDFRRPGIRYVDNIEMNLQVMGLGIELM